MEPEDQEQEIEMQQEPIVLGGGAVNSVNGKTGDVVLTTSDLENDSGYQNGTQVENAIETAIGQIEIPTKTSDLDNDGEDGTSTYVEAADLAKVATTGDYDDLIDKPTIPTVNDATLTITQNGTSKGTFTANDADDTTIEVSDTTYSNFTGTDGVSAGTAGLVPAPATTDAGKFLKADGTWDTAGGGGPTVVQTKGASTTDVMSQDATTKLIYPDIANNPYQQVIGEGLIYGTNKGLAINGIINTGINGGSIAIGSTNFSSAQIGLNGRANNSIAIGADAGAGRGMQSVAIGANAYTNSGQNTGDNVAIGYNSYAGNNSQTSTVALGAYAKTTRTGEVNVGAGTSGTGYNSTNYRVIGGVHDGQDAHDAVTVGQLNATIDAINTVLSTNIPHVGA